MDLTKRIPTSTNEAIIEFYNKILATEGNRFQAIDLTNYVEQFNLGTTKETIMRALRNLRAKGKVNVEIVNAGQRIYQAWPLTETSVTNG